MNKKLVIGIIVAVAIIALIVGGYFIFTPKTKNEANKTLDLPAISTSIKETGFKEMSMMDIDSTVLASVFQINEDEVEEFVGKMPMMNVQASMYLIVKAKEEKLEDVKQKVEAYGISYEEQWARYLPAQYELVQNRKIGTIGNYVYMIVAENAEDLVTLIK